MKKRDFESRHFKRTVLLQTYFVIFGEKKKKSPCQISYCTFYDMEQKKYIVSKSVPQRLVKDAIETKPTIE